MKRVIIALTTIVLIATAAIGVAHYYSVKILSASRAYTNFESQYSKGEKDASRHLMSYIYSHDEVDYLAFKNDISIPIGDSIARNALTTGKDIRIARIGFLMAGNHPDDLPELVWFFHRFKNVALFKTAINAWQESDIMVGKLNRIGAVAYNKIHSGKPVDKEDLVLQINTISDNLTIKQLNFSAVLGITSRMVDHYVFIADLTISIIILACSALLAGIMLRKLHTSKKVITEQNLELKLMNERVSKFVYTVTHDLRSPLSSLTGLVSVLEREKDITKIPEYTAMMKESLELQDKSIHDVLNTIINANSKKEEVCNLGDIVNDVISQNSFFAEGKKVKFLNELEVWELKCNVTDLKVIFNNLISNAIKYADFNKPEQWIRVKTYRNNQNCVIEIEDNGLGIKPDQKSSIFNKYFKSGINKKSMGLGLYFTKQAIEDMNGTITVKSLLGIGTSFIVSLPL
ncbi:sensor histidine kinase [Mucilaginibacter sp.]|uniref:sensor histidine kinase n=1 Tax=Mucilaginibacter sp. TaxID=1882438 RepID=UPI003D0B3502